MVKTVTYQSTNSYEIINPITENTQQIWVCFHGLGYLSAFFKKYFKAFNPETCSFIIPQAPSKFYIDKAFKYVGACWLTRVDTQMEMQNNLNYLNSIFIQEHLIGDPRIVFMGYSQGVSIATRFMKQYPHPIKALVMHSGSIPKELTSEDGQQFKKNSKHIFHISGTLDEYVNDEVIKHENERIETLFGTVCEQYRPEIKHEVATDLLLEISHKLT